MRGAGVLRGLCLVLPIVVLSCGGRASTTDDAASGDGGEEAAAPGEAGEAADLDAKGSGDATTGPDTEAGMDTSVDAGPGDASNDATVDGSNDVSAADSPGDAPGDAPPADAAVDALAADAVADVPVADVSSDVADASVDASASEASTDASADQDAAPESGPAFVWPTCAADGGDAGGDAAAGDGGARNFQQVLTGASWNVGQSVAGMAVDAQGRVYIADSSNVYVYVCGQLLVYMTAAEAAAIAGHASDNSIQDMDMAPDGSLYLLLSAGIVRSTAPHSGALFQSTLSLTFPHRIGAIASGDVAVVHRGGLTQYAADGGSLVYAASALGFPQCGAVEDLTTDPSGVFLYNEGCNGSPLLRGNLDGSGVGTLATATTTSLGVSNFICSARDPAGGFYTVIADGISSTLTGVSHLYHVSETATGTSAFTEVVTSPTFIDAASSQSETLAFRYCSLAVGLDGAVYFQTMSQLWRVSP